MYPLLNDEQINEIVAEKADNVVITGESNHKEIGIRVGLFSQTASINTNLDHEQQVRAVRDVYRELRMMNERDKWQHTKAAEALKKGQ